MTNTRPYQITAELLSTLRTEGFVLGIGKHLQIQTLLQKLPADTSDDALKLALIPLLAQSPSEQERLYGIFDDCVKRVNDTELTEEEKQELQKGEEKAITQAKLWRFIIPSVLALLLVFCGAIWWKSNQKLAPPEPQKDTTSHFTQDTITPVKEQVSYFVDNKPYPFPNHLEEYDIEVSPNQQWLSNNWAWLRWVLAVTLTVLLLALWRYLVWKRRKLVAEQDPNDKPPYFWNVHIESVNDFLEHDSFDRVSQLLRKRADTDTLRLDMPRTIQATVEKGGMPEFRFKKQTTPSEYLLLIDRQSVRNHRAQLFDKLYEAFKAQEIEIHRYFYDSDMRMCFDEAHPYGISIADVQQRHYQSRLIVVGTGAQMLAPLSGKLAAWTSIFSQWKDRALLTPKPLKAWGYDERQLASVFTTLPSTLQGLGFWVEELDMGNDARFETWREKIHDAPNAPIQPDELDPMPLLSLYYDIPMLKWICACAIYPTLHWDLTLWLYSEVNSEKLKVKSEPSTIHSSLFTDLTELTRLSWFVSGEMPNETRVALINWLEEHDPKLLQHLRLAIALELQKNPPPADSVAFEPFRMSVAVNEWLATDDAARKKELEEEIKQLLEKGIDPDFTVIKYLDKPRTQLEFYMPESWKKYVYPKGFSALGWLKEVKDLRWLIPLWILGLVALFYPYNFKTNNCSSDKIVSLTVRDITRYFCLADPLSTLAYQEQLVHDAFDKNNPTLADSLLVPDARINGKLYRYGGTKTYFSANSIKPIILHPLSIELLLNDAQREDTLVKKLLNERDCNFAVDYYRLAKQFYDKGQKDSTCFYLDRASKFDSTDAEIKIVRALICNRKPDNVAKPLKVATIFEGSVFIDDDNTTLQPLTDVKVVGAGISALTNIKGRYTFTLPSDFPLPQITLTFLKKGYETNIQNFDIYNTNKLFDVALKPETSKPNIVDTPKTQPVPSVTTTPSPKESVVTVPATDTSKRDIVTTQQPPTTNNQQPITIIAPATVPVKGGTFTMGCTKEQGGDCGDDEKPPHQVTLSDFNIGQFEVTVEQYMQFVTDTKTHYPEWLEEKSDYNIKTGKDDHYKKIGYALQNPKNPIVGVSWDDATAYCQWLSIKTGKKYRLPTEAEWEYAARGGSQSRSYKYSGSNNIGEVAWYTDNSDNKTHTVGTKKANELGIYDMSGNVWEWCSDSYSNYSSTAVKNPTGAGEKGTDRVARGGSWGLNAQDCRVSDRLSGTPANRNNYLGFRVVFSP